MLRYKTSTSSADAKRYFREALSPGDYYTSPPTHDRTGQELPGMWGGEAATRLGLTGPVGQAGFEALCDNLHPPASESAAGEKLTVRSGDNRRVGWDLNFHAPKSVSVLHAMTGDEAILNAFQEAVRETMQQLEREAMTRVRKEGQDRDRLTGNLVWSEFTHLTARPIGGVPDPHLHTHCFTFNATYDEQESRWKAAQLGKVLRDAPYYEAIFHAHLASKLQDTGYEIWKVPGKERLGSWELKGVAPRLNDEFSRRTSEINAVAEELGITDPAAKGELGAKTRKKKDKDSTISNLTRNWSGRVSEQEHASLHDACSQAQALRDNGGFPKTSQDSNARLGVDFALDHVLERSSVADSRQLMTHAIWNGVVNTSGEAVEQELQRRIQSGEVIMRADKERWLITTQAILNEERAMLDFVRSGRGTVAPIQTEPHTFKREFFSDEQKAAVNHVLNSQDRVMVIRGGAGVGKTTLMQEAAEAMQAKGKTLHAFAPSADASRKTLRGAGFKDANTLASLFANPELQSKLKNQIVWVDEAGMMGTRDMAKLCKLAEKTGCRLLLTGDTRQHKSVSRGDPLRLLETEAGVPIAEVSEIRRQRGVYRDAVKAIQDGDLKLGFENLDRMDAVREVEHESRHVMLAADYIEGVQQGESVLVVSPTHAEGRQVTAAIRDGLKQEGKLTGEDRVLASLKSLQLTDAQKEQSTSYEKGQIIQFTKRLPDKMGGMRAGDRWLITGHNKHGHPLMRPIQSHGPAIREQAVPTILGARFEVFEKRDLPLAAGDQIRFTHNGRTKDQKHKLDNGKHYEVAGFTRSGDLKLENGWVVDKNHGHMTHGYCVTSHASQSKTKDRVLIALGSMSMAAANLEQFYVSTSRGKKALRIYTDDKAALMEAVAKRAVDLSATEMMKLPVAGVERSMSPLTQMAIAVNRMQVQSQQRGQDRERTVTPAYKQDRERTVTHDPGIDRGRDIER